jgi:crotonobetainyl-CoA:carnitine CoA-transferase CaiB-like acyl-CoA transferase
MTAPPPLAGVRVLEVGNYMAGPFCGLQLADLGADVVKVEEPAQGDLARGMPPMVGADSGNFARLNRGKRSLALDLKAEEGRELFRTLAARADVVVENLRPGTMRELGLLPQDLVRDHPRLVYAAISGWGQDGPYADRPALDIIVQAVSGLMSITGEEGGAPVKVGVSIADLSAALYGTVAILAALRARERDGRGQLIDVSMFESSVALAVWEAGEHFTTGEVPRAAGSAHKLQAPYQAVRAADGHFVIGATSPRNWTAFCRVLGTEALEMDARFADASSRRQRVRELIPLIEAVTETKPMAHWLAELRKAGVPCGEIRDYAEVFRDEHLAARGFFVEMSHSSLGKVRGLGSPLRFERTPVRLERAGPLLGEHSEEVLLEAGITRDHIARLVASGTVRTATAATPR